MCNGPVFKKVLIFVVPLILSSILQLLYNAADLIVVGRWAGERALAAVGATTSLVGLFTQTFISVSIGANVVVALTGTFLSAYYTDSVGIAAAAVGTMLLVCRSVIYIA